MLFAGFIIYMVVQAFQEDFDLVAEDYYAQEIAYQQKMQQKANVLSLEQKIQFSVADSGISIKYPEDQSPVGKVHFYHPSRKMLDRKFDITIDELNTQFIPREKLIAGNYKIKVQWNHAGKEYYQQEDITVR